MSRPKKEKRNGLYMIDFYYTNVIGERKRKKLHNFKTQREAEQAKHDFLNKVNELPLNEDTFTVGDLYVSYSNTKKNWAESTKKRNDSIYTNHIKPYFSSKDVRSIKHNNLIKWITELQNKNVSNKQINKSIELFKCLIDFYNKINYCNLLPFNQIIFLKQDPKKEQLIIDVDDFYKLLNSSNNFNEYAMFWFLFWTGVRPSEMYCLQWNKINFDDNTVLISNSLIFYNKRNWKLGPVKNHRPRTINLDQKTKDILLKLKDEKKNYDCFDDSFFVFQNKLPMNRPYFEHRLHLACDKAKINRINPHALRHSFVSNINAHINDLKTVSDYIGHKDSTITAKVYEHVLKNNKEKIIDAVNDLSKTGYK